MVGILRVYPSRESDCGDPVPAEAGLSVQRAIVKHGNPASASTAWFGLKQTYGAIYIFDKISRVRNRMSALPASHININER